MYAKSGARGRRRTDQLPPPAALHPRATPPTTRSAGHCRSLGPGATASHGSRTGTVTPGGGTMRNPAVRSLWTIRPESVDGSGRRRGSANRLYPTSVQKRVPVPFHASGAQPRTPSDALRPPLPSRPTACTGTRTAPGGGAPPEPSPLGSAPRPITAETASPGTPADRRGPGPSSPRRRPRAAPPGSPRGCPRSCVTAVRCSDGDTPSPACPSPPGGSRQAPAARNALHEKRGSTQTRLRRLHRRPPHHFSSRDSEKPGAFPAPH